MALTESEEAARQAFGVALRQLRTARGWSLQELRDRMRDATGYTVSPQQIGQWEAGKPSPGPSAMEAIELALAAPGLGLIMSVDTGAFARLTDEVAGLRDRITALEAASTSPTRPGEEDGERHLYPVAAEQGGEDHLAPTPTDISDRPMPPPIEPDLDPPGPDFEADPPGPEDGA